MMKKVTVLALIVIAFVLIIGDAGFASPVGPAIKRGVRYIDDLGRMVLNKGDDAARIAVQYADDLAKIAYRYGDDVAEIVSRHGDEAILFLNKYGDNAADLVRKYGDEVFKISARNRARLLKLNGKYPDSVVRVALHGGDDAIKALARKQLLTKPITWMKKHPITLLVTGALIWFRDAITSQGTAIAKVGISIVGIMVIIILMGFLSGFFFLAVKSCILAFRALKKILSSPRVPEGSLEERAD